MYKKITALFAAAALIMAGLALYTAFQSGDAALPSTDKDTADRSVSCKSVSTLPALSASEKMTLLCCGTVSGTDFFMEQSAFHTDFVPREPEYVERFRNYYGPEAEFVPVMMYHFFYDEKTEKPAKGANSHSIQSVRKQLGWLWENGYVTLSMDELYEWLNGNIDLPAKCILITSDDGQDNFFDLLQPELHEYGFVATSFVITSWRKNIPYKLTLPNIELHSHTHNMHRGMISEGGIPDNRGMMQGVSVEEGVEDLSQSQSILNGSRYFAYPYGNYGGNSKEILRQAGFRLAFTTHSGLVHRGDDPLQLDRIRVMGSIETDVFSGIIQYEKAMKQYR